MGHRPRDNERQQAPNPNEPDLAMPGWFVAFLLASFGLVIWAWVRMF